MWVLFWFSFFFLLCIYITWHIFFIHVNIVRVSVCLTHFLKFNVVYSVHWLTKQQSSLLIKMIVIFSVNVDWPFWLIAYAQNVKCWRIFLFPHTAITRVFFRFDLLKNNYPTHIRWRRRRLKTTIFFCLSDYVPTNYSENFLQLVLRFRRDLSSRTN